MWVLFETSSFESGPRAHARDVAESDAESDARPHNSCPARAPIRSAPPTSTGACLTTRPDAHRRGKRGLVKPAGHAIGLFRYIEAASPGDSHP
jgi:hypothetical protein